MSFSTDEIVGEQIDENSFLAERIRTLSRDGKFMLKRKPKNDSVVTLDIGKGALDSGRRFDRVASRSGDYFIVVPNGWP